MRDISLDSANPIETHKKLRKMYAIVCYCYCYAMHNAPAITYYNTACKTIVCVRVNTLFVFALPFCILRLVLALLLNVLYLSAECVLFLYWRHKQCNNQSVKTKNR